MFYTYISQRNSPLRGEIFWRLGTWGFRPFCFCAQTLQNFHVFLERLSWVKMTGHWCPFKKPLTETFPRSFKSILIFRDLLESLHIDTICQCDEAERAKGATEVGKWGRLLWQGGGIAASAASLCMHMYQRWGKMDGYNCRYYYS